jgi:hypothetical protein
VLNPTDPESVRDALQLIADENYPGHRGGEFCIRTVLGPVVVGLSPFRRPDPPRTQRYEPDPQTLSDAEAEVLQVMREAGPGAVLSGEDIAGRIGAEYTGTFRTVMATMARRGLVKRPPGRPGYQLP